MADNQADSYVVIDNFTSSGNTYYISEPVSLGSDKKVVQFIANTPEECTLTFDIYGTNSLDWEPVLLSTTNKVVNGSMQSFGVVIDAPYKYISVAVVMPVADVTVSASIGV